VEGEGRCADVATLSRRCAVDSAFTLPLDCPRVSSAGEELVVSRGDVRFALHVRRSRRKTLAIHVFADGRVEARAPLRCPRYVIADFARARFEWINSSLAGFLENPVPARRFEPGSTHRFLGVDYRVEVVEAKPHAVCIVGGALVAGLTNPDRLQAALEAWYRDRALVYLPARLANGYQRFCRATGVDKPMPALRIRKMRARWGSCSRRGEICLNSLLMRLSPRLIDLVIAHELCHLSHFNHGPLFYELLENAMPDWRVREADLQHLAPA